MEVILASGVLGLGYLLKGKGERHEEGGKIAENRIPSTNNMYDSNYSKLVQNRVEERASNTYLDSKRPIETNVIPQNFMKNITNSHNEPNINVPGDIRDEGKPQKQGHLSSLTGTVIEDFTHNNMVPFFGDSARQNVYEYANQSILENHTGNMNYSIQKKEQAPLFNPERNVGNVNGADNYDEALKERYFVSKFRRNETPIERVNVGPGLNAGYNAEPKGGFHQFEVNNIIKPKTVDDLRVLTNQKETFKGRVVGGKALNDKRELAAQVFKHRPDTTFEHGPSRYFTTTGAHKREKKRATVVLSDTNRQKLNKTELGAASRPHGGSKITQRAKYQRSKSNIYEGSGPRNAHAPEQWTDGEFGDYGREGIEMYPNERDITGVRTHVSNIASVFKELALPIQDVFRTTKKENTEHHRSIGNFGVQGPSKITVYDPTDIARITGRNTLDAVDTTANLKGPNRLTVYDPNDVARTTMKETNVDNNRLGNVSIAHIENGGYIIESSVADAPHTNRQFTSDHFYSGGAGSVNSKNKSYKNYESMRTNEMREKTLEGRAPTTSNVSLNTGSENVNININRNNLELGRTPNMSGKRVIGTNITTKESYGEQTSTRPNYDCDNKKISDRINPMMVDAFRNNPYTQSLDSVSPF